MIQDFWGTCGCPENRVYPENFQARGGLPPPPNPRLVRLCLLRHSGHGVFGLCVNPSLEKGQGTKWKIILET